MSVCSFVFENQILVYEYFLNNRLGTDEKRGFFTYGTPFIG